MSVAKTIKSGIDSGHGTALLYAGMIGLVLSDIIPTPADAAYFYAERNLRDKWKHREITPEQYWSISAAYYYVLNPIWWTLVGITVVSIKGDASKKIKVLGGLIGAGAVLAVIHKNIVKDKQELALENNNLTPMQRELKEMKNL